MSIYVCRPSSGLCLHLAHSQTLPTGAHNHTSQLICLIIALLTHPLSHTHTQCLSHLLGLVYTLLLQQFSWHKTIHWIFLHIPIYIFLYPPNTPTPSLSISRILSLSIYYSPFSILPLSHTLILGNSLHLPVSLCSSYSLLLKDFHCSSLSFPSILFLLFYISIFPLHTFPLSLSDTLLLKHSLSLSLSLPPSFSLCLPPSFSLSLSLSLCILPPHTLSF